MGAVTSVTEAALQDLLACGKADGLVLEPGNWEIEWPASAKLSRLDAYKDGKVV